MKRLLVILVLLVLNTPSSANAQQCFSHGQFRIGGHPFICSGATTCIDPRLNDLGKAFPGQGIYLHPALNAYPIGVIAFVFAHECAHFRGILDEQLADRWAIKVGRDQGWINPQTVTQICQSFYFSPGDWTHFPGPLRCQNMIHAFSTP